MSSGCSRQGAVMAPSSASSRTWRAILQDEVCPCPCNDCNGHTPSSWIWNFRQSGQESTTWKKALLWVLCIHQYAAACCSVRPASHRRHSSALPAKSAILPGTITFAMERVDAQPTALTPPAWAAQQAWATAATAHKTLRAQARACNYFGNWFLVSSQRLFLHNAYGL